MKIALIVAFIAASAALALAMSGTGSPCTRMADAIDLAGDCGRR